MSKSSEQAQQTLRTKKYQKISNEQRKVVLDLLQKEKMSLQEVANRLSLKYCTVRTIQKAFEKDGRIGKKETRKKKLRVESVLKVSILNPVTLQVQPVLITSDTSQVFVTSNQMFVDKQPTASDQANLAKEQRQLLFQQCQQLFQTLHSQLLQSQIVPNPYYSSNIQNLLLSSQFIFKQILDTQPSPPIKQYCEPVTPLFQGFQLPLQPAMQFQPQYPYLIN